MLKDWQERALKMTHANESQVGAILCCAFYAPDYRKARPRFEGKAYHTSDGFLLCDFVEESGEYHRGAFVGAWADLYFKVMKLADLLKLTVDERQELLHYVKSWVRWN